MGTSFFSKSSTQYLSHTETEELSYTGQGPTVDYGFASCHLFDILALAGFITSNIRIGYSEQPSLLDVSPSASIYPELYQSRAPPTLIL